MNLISRLRRDLLVYGLGGVLTKSVSILSIPLITSQVTPEAFGSLEMLLLIGMMAGSYYVFGLDSSMSFYYSKYRFDNVKKANLVFSIVFYNKILLFFFLIMFLFSGNQLFNLADFGLSLGPKNILISLCSAFFLQLLLTFSEKFRFDNEPISYLSVTVSQSLLALCIGLYLLYAEGYGISGILLGNLISSIVILFVTMCKHFPFRLPTREDYHLFKSLLGFGVPLFASGSLLLLMNSIDRWFVFVYLDSSELASFAISVKLTMIIFFSVELFRKAWWPIAMEQLHADDLSKNTLFGVISEIYIAFCSFGVLVLVVSSEWLIGLMIDERYLNSWQVLSILAFHPIIYGYYMIATLGLWKSEKTSKTVLITFVGLAFGCLFNVALIPLLGSLGAAIATILSDLIWIIALIIISKKEVNIDLHLYRVASYLVISGCFSMLWIIKEDLSFLIFGIGLAILTFCMGYLLSGTLRVYKTYAKKHV